MAFSPIKKTLVNIDSCDISHFFGQRNTPIRVSFVRPETLHVAMSLKKKWFDPSFPRPSDRRSPLIHLSRLEFFTLHFPSLSFTTPWLPLMFGLFAPAYTPISTLLLLAPWGILGWLLRWRWRNLSKTLTGIRSVCWVQIALHKKRKITN